jgi:hypothetical protein
VRFPIDPRTIAEYDPSAPPRSTSAPEAELRRGLSDAIATFSEVATNAAPPNNHPAAAALQRIAAGIAAAP